MNWTPFVIRVVLHHFYSTAECELSNSPIYPQTIHDLMEQGVIEHRDQCAGGETAYQTTALGRALVDMWCKQPLPIVTYVDPRFAEGQPR